MCSKTLVYHIACVLPDGGHPHHRLRGEPGPLTLNKFADFLIGFGTQVAIGDFGKHEQDFIAALSQVCRFNTLRLTYGPHGKYKNTGHMFYFIGPTNHMTAREGSLATFDNDPQDDYTIAWPTIEEVHEKVINPLYNGQIAGKVYIRGQMPYLRTKERLTARCISGWCEQRARLGSSTVQAVGCDNSYKYHCRCQWECQCELTAEMNAEENTMVEGNGNSNGNGRDTGDATCNMKGERTSRGHRNGRGNLPPGGHCHWKGNSGKGDGKRIVRNKFNSPW